MAYNSVCVYLIATITAYVGVGIAIAFMLIIAAMLISTVFGIIKKRQTSHNNSATLSTINHELIKHHLLLIMLYNIVELHVSQVNRCYSRSKYFTNSYQYHMHN